MGSITQDPKFNYRQEYTQYLRLEKDSEYNVRSQILHVHSLKKILDFGAINLVTM